MPTPKPISQSIPRSILILALAGFIHASWAEEWVVPAQPLAAEFHFQATVDIDRAATELVLPTARELVATWVVPHGSPVAKGDPLIVFSSDWHQRRVEERQRDLVVVNADMRLRELRLADDRSTIADESQSLRGDLAVAEASLLAADRIDPQTVALAEATRAQAVVELTRLDRVLTVAKRALAAGDITQDEAARREQDRINGVQAVAQATAELADLRGRDVALLRERRRLRCEDIRMRLGIDAQGQAITGAGLTGRMEALEAQQRRERRQVQERRERAERELHEATRDAWDHVPLRSLTIGPSAWRFSAPGPGAEKDLGQAIVISNQEYTSISGCGFIDTLGTLFPVLRAGRQGKPGSGAVIIRGQATFQATLPPGTYPLRLELGDDRDWDGIVVAVVDADGRRIIAVERRIEANQPRVVTTTIRVDAQPVRIECGDRFHKALRATVAGLALPREWIAPGWKAGWTRDPAAFLAGTGSVRLRAFVHQDFARLLHAAEPVNATVAAAAAETRAEATAEATADSKPADPVDLVEQLSVTQVEWQGADGQHGSAEVANVIGIAVPLSLRADAADDGPLDQLGNEIILRIPGGGDPTQLRPGSAVTVQVTIPVPQQCTVLPAQLVGRSGERWYVQVVGAAPQRCQAVAVDGRFVVTPALPPGTLLEPVSVDAADAGETRFNGEIVAGRSSPVVSVSASGRIAEMIPDGSEVTAGQRIVGLYSPWIEERRDENARRTEQAAQVYAESEEARRVAAERASVEHRAQVISENIARLDAQLAATPDPLAIATATAEYARADAENILAQQILLRAEALGDAQRLDSARRSAAQAAVTVQRRALGLAAAKQAVNWLTMRDTQAAWDDAVSDLGGREQDLLQARVQEKASSLRAELALADAMQGNRWERQFEQGKDLVSPVSGRLFYRKGWDDRTNRNATFQKDFWVWRGMTVADVLDTADLAFEVDLPETRVMALTVGDTVTVILTRFDHRRLAAKIESIGRAVVAAPDDDPTGVERRLGLRRVVRVRCAFAVPAELRDRLIPGTKGELELL